MMTGIVKVGTGAGQFAAPFLASVLIAFYGWRQAYITIGLAALVLLLWIAQILQSRPEDQDVPILTGSKSGRVQVNPVILRSLNASQALGTLQLWLLCTANVLLVFCLLIIIVHIVPHAIDTGLSSRQAAGVLSTIGAVSMVGRFASGWSIDRIGSKAVMLNCFAILISVLFWLQIADCPWKLYLFASVYGLAHGGFFTAISPIVAEIFGIASHGAIFGMIVFSGTVGGSVGPVVAGKIFDSMGSYALTFQMITVLSVISLGLIILVKPIEH
jgi:MFS family permease